MFRTILALSLASTFLCAASEREVAEWVIRWEGRVILEGIRQPLDDVSQLPAGDFRITGIDLTWSVLHPAELAKLGGLVALRELHLPGPIWNPGGGNEDANDALKVLSVLKNIEKLQIGWHYAAQINIRDTGMRHLAGLTELKDFRCAQCRITNFSMEPFKKLRSLDLSFSPFTDAGLEGLAGLKDLRRLILRDTMVTDEGLRHLSGLVLLEELDLSGTRVTHKGIEALRNLTAMRKLNLLGAQATDASMDVLFGMKRLQVLNLYRTRITNAGLARLQGLKELTDVDLRYSRVTPNGAESLRAALPNSKVHVVGSSPPRPKVAAAAQPAAGADREVAEWVKAMGGATEFAADRLQTIRLSSTSVSDEQLSHLLGLTSLEKLDLSITQIGDLGLRALEGLTSLKDLNLSQTTVSDAGLEKLTRLSR
ncbi:MAG: leucine-rich repeat domain-containing protein, partial [Bryobacteraceae bacterium]